MIKKHAILLAVAVSLLAAFASGQTPAPFTRSGDLLVTDTNGDRIWRLSDLDLDGAYDGAAEITTFFQNGGLGLGMQLPAGIAVARDGVVYICDTTNDVVLRCHDLSGDGDALDAGETTVFFGSATNQSGIAAPSMLALTVAVTGEVYATNAGSSAQPLDGILRLVDLNGDFDAEDPGEAKFYASLAPGAAGNASLPSAVTIGPDGNVYYADSGTTGVIAAGVHRLVDLNTDGDCDDAGEQAPYFIPPAGANQSNFYGLAFDRLGNVFLADHGNDVIRRARDLDASNSITVGVEDVIYYTIPPMSLAWTMALALDGRIFVTEDQAPDRIFELTDLDSSGDCNGPGERRDVYTDTVSPTDLGAPRSLAFMKGPGITAYPNPVPIGTVVQLGFEGTAYDVFAGFFSLAPTFLPLPPFGVVGIDPSPGIFFEILPAFAFSASGELVLPIFIPAQPSLSGVTIYLQGFGGNAGRTFLSNTLPLTFQ